MSSGPTVGAQVAKATSSAGNDSWSPDIFQSNFENVRPISHYDWPR